MKCSTLKRHLETHARNEILDISHCHAPVAIIMHHLYWWIKDEERRAVNKLEQENIL